MSSWDHDSKPANNEQHHETAHERYTGHHQDSAGNAQHEEGGEMNLHSPHGHEHEHDSEHHHHEHEHDEGIHADDEGIAESHSHEKGEHSTGHNKESYHSS